MKKNILPDVKTDLLQKFRTRTGELNFLTKIVLVLLFMFMANDSFARKHHRRRTHRRRSSSVSRRVRISSDFDNRLAGKFNYFKRRVTYHQNSSSGSGYSDNRRKINEVNKDIDAKRKKIAELKELKQKQIERKRLEQELKELE